MKDSLVVVPNTREDGTCKYCRRAIVWVIVARLGPGRPARTLPFQPHVEPLEAFRDENDVAYERWPAAALHTKHCAQAPKKDPTPKRLLRASRDGQGRMW